MKTSFLHLPTDLQELVFDKLFDGPARSLNHSDIVGYVSTLRATSKSFDEISQSILKEFVGKSIAGVDPLDHDLLIKRLARFPQTKLVQRIQRQFYPQLHVVRSTKDAQRFSRLLCVDTNATVYFVWNTPGDSKREKSTHVPKLQRAMRQVAAKIPDGTIVLFDHGIRRDNPVPHNKFELPDIRRIAVYANYLYFVDSPRLREFFAADLFPGCLIPNLVGIVVGALNAPNLQRIASRRGYRGAFLKAIGNPLRSLETFDGVDIWNRRTTDGAMAFPNLKRYVVEECYHKRFAHYVNVHCTCCTGMPTSNGTLFPETYSATTAPWHFIRPSRATSAIDAISNGSRTASTAPTYPPLYPM